MPFSDFISSDRRVITLPVQLGQTVYVVSTSCNDACSFQQEKFDEVFAEYDGGRCSSKLPCHTKIHSIRPVRFREDSMVHILNGWGYSHFKTEEEARRAATIRIEENKSRLIELGLSIE